ncbi:MAG: amino acid permease [Alphaproteobacteria bacterium]|uniref:Amino acid permease n=1 Tax=Candidatus Nitrobium versatile TaxID=2884831 RepID=A0A953M2C5_9BACT|nr:amino acid permease [Candidatus Nitrobium versatile]
MDQGPGADRSPEQTLSPVDAVAIIIGIVIGAGIFKTPSLVAAFSGSEGLALLVWLAGGGLSLIGALCYAELTAAYPNAGGDYHYIGRAFGSGPSFLFAWARMTVIQTGSIAMVAFLIGDYASEVLRWGEHSPSFYAAGVVTALTAVNIAGLRQGKVLQNLLTAGILAGLFAVMFCGALLSPPAPPAGDAPPAAAVSPGKAMVFVLLTYGGWNEAAYISAEVREAQRTMVRILVSAIGLITVVYLAVNFVFLRGLGLGATAASEAVAADFMRRALGEWGARFISLLIALAALSTANASIITGARTCYALGRDFSLFGFLGRWSGRTGTPCTALLVQGGLALVLIGLGTITRNGFATMVEYTAPVFWFFFLLAGASLFVLRRKEPHAARPFRVPLYPLTPLLFCAVCVYMLHASIVYTGFGALAGIGVMSAGVPLFFAAHRRENHTRRKEASI